VIAISVPNSARFLIAIGSEYPIAIASEHRFPSARNDYFLGSESALRAETRKSPPAPVSNPSNWSTNTWPGPILRSRKRSASPLLQFGLIIFKATMRIAKPP